MQSWMEANLLHCLFGKPRVGMPPIVWGQAVVGEGASKHATAKGAVGQEGNPQLSTCRDQVILQHKCNRLLCG